MPRSARCAPYRKVLEALGRHLVALIEVGLVLLWCILNALLFLADGENFLLFHVSRNI